MSNRDVLPETYAHEREPPPDPEREKAAAILVSFLRP